MAGPPEQYARHLVVPAGEAQKLYTPAALAWRIENFRWHPDGYLTSVRGPAPYEPQRGEDYPSLDGRPHGIFHAGLLGGIADTLLVRSGVNLYRHAGWLRDYQDLSNLNGDTPLTDDGRPTYPDQFVVLNGLIVWTNGADRPRVINHEGMVVPLGFDRGPPPPEVRGPAQPSDIERDKRLPNSYGYSWPGRIGTLGDVLDGATGALLQGSWTHAAQYEDIYGNLSPLSPRSAPVTIFTQNSVVATDSASNNTVQLDDLLRMFAVYIGSGTQRLPEHIAAVRTCRTRDEPRNGPQLYFHDRHPGRNITLVPDSKSDMELGGAVVDMAPVTPFRVMTAHAGRLLAGNFHSDPAIVRRSQAGFPGSFPVDDWIYPDSGGAEVTALASHGGRVLAFTERSAYDITDMPQPPVSVARGIGCTAPRSIQALPSGELVWLSRDGFYAAKPGEYPRLISESISRTIFSDINQSRMRAAVSAYDPTSQEYLCAVCPAGSNDQTLLLRYDGVQWKRCNYGITIDDITVTDDYRKLVLFVGRDLTNDITGTWVMDHEVDSTIYAPPARSNIFQSGWMRADETGLDRVEVRSLYIAMVDGSATDGTVELFADGSWAPLVTFTNLRLMGLDEGTGIVSDVAGLAVLGTSKFHERRVKWRQVPCAPHLNAVRQWAFRITTTTPTNIIGFAFDLSTTTRGLPRADVPGPGDL